MLKVICSALLILMLAMALGPNDESQSMIKQVIDSQYKISWHEQSPFGDDNGGYLALSHNQNINAWFDEDQVVIRPSGNSEQWKFGMHLKSVGYGNQLQPAPEVSKRITKGSRIEYQRSPTITEWYENRPAGIEQGFTLAARPVTSNRDGDLRVVVEVSGNLKPSVEEQRIALRNAQGEKVLSYEKLIVIDSNARNIPAHLETAATNEITIVVDDRDAVYPLVIDPITTVEEHRINASSQNGANFGFSVALAEDFAIIGAPLVDFSATLTDTGTAYVFRRDNTSWTLDGIIAHPNLSRTLRCGFSVDVVAGRFVIGCPGTQETKGSVLKTDFFGPGNYPLTQLEVLAGINVREGDRFGASVAINESAQRILIGAPAVDLNPSQGDTNDGAAYLVTDAGGLLQTFQGDGGLQAGNQFGTDVAIDYDASTIVIGEPLADAFNGSTLTLDVGRANVYERDPQSGVFIKTTVVVANDRAAGDNFGFTVGVSRGNVAVGAPFEDNERGVNAGAVYLYAKQGANWTQQQKIVVPDGVANDEFSRNAIAVQGNTLVVGAHLADGPNFPFDPNDDRGLVYVYFKTPTGWVEEARIRASTGAPGDEFGIAVDIAKNRVIVGARSDDLQFTIDSGSAYFYRLSCSAVEIPQIAINYGRTLPGSKPSRLDVCEGQPLNLFVTFPELSDSAGVSFQWRRNGVNIPNATGQALSLSSLKTTDAGFYDVVVSNSCNSQIALPIDIQVFTGCGITPAERNFPASGESGSINVSACPTCVWGLPGPNPIGAVTFTPIEGQGNGTINYTVAPNLTDSPRELTVRIAGKPFRVTQDPNTSIVTFVVRNTNNDGADSLRAAVVGATSQGRSAEIRFDLPGDGPHTIALSNDISPIFNNVVFLNDRPGDEKVTITTQGAIPTRVFSVTARSTTFAGITFGGTTARKGGISVSNANVTIRNCTFQNNSGDLNSGIALEVDQSTVRVVNSTFMNNSGPKGAAIHNRPGGDLSLINTTISQNTAPAGGGGLYNQGVVRIYNSTFVDNKVNNIVFDSGIGTITNSLFKRATGNSNFAAINGGIYTSEGHNLSDDAAGGDGGAGPGGFLNGPGDRRNTDPQIGPLADNFGPTLTHRLNDNSPAINAGDNSVLGAPANASTDQRGLLRRAGANVDIGAYEFGTFLMSPNSFQFSAFSLTRSEAGNSFGVQVTRTGDIQAPASVDYETSDPAPTSSCSEVNGLASSRCDYIFSKGTLEFLPGETVKTLPILLTNDSYVEPLETFSVFLNRPVNATLDGFSKIDLRLESDDEIAGANPIALANFFVREHYLDFLNREPDAGGFNFWTNEITSCAFDTQCTAVKRVNVSAAFFLSIEFQQTGYLIYRFHKAGFGNLPGTPVPVKLIDFLADTQEIGRNVVVGGPGWGQILESNKQKFALAFVRRSKFLTAYPDSMTADQVVTKMNNNAGGVLSASERANLVAVLGPTPSDPEKRAQVLRAVAEDSDLRSAEFNRAFVLMQYFGYLRRDPNQLPDTNYDGYNFWLNKLNSFGGNFVNAEMVKAFILSGEYRQRFGP